MFNALFETFDQVAVEAAKQQVIKDTKCWAKHAITAAAGSVLLVRQMMAPGISGGTSETFMAELGKFRKDVADQVDRMDINQLKNLFTKKPDLSLLNKPDWLDEDEWDIFTMECNYQLRKMAEIAAHIADTKMAKLQEMMNGKR